MKNVILISLTLALVLSSSVLSYAKSNNSNPVSEQIEISNTSTTDTNLDNTTKTQPTAEELQSKLIKLREAFKSVKKDHIAKKALLDQIAKAKAEANNEVIDVFIKGDTVDLDVAPIVKNDHTLIPIRAIMDKFGAIISWDEATSTVTITKNDTVIKLVIGSDVAIVNGADVKLDLPAEVKDNRTLVPIRFIAETLKQKVDYDDASKTIIIDDENTSDTLPVTNDPSMDDPSLDVPSIDAPSKHDLSPEDASTDPNAIDGFDTEEPADNWTEVTQ